MNIAVPEEKYSSWLIHRLNHRNIAHSVLGICVGINTLDVELIPCDMFAIIDLLSVD